MGKIKVKKFSGELVDFDMEKLKNSLRRTKAGEELIQSIVATVKNRLYDGISTKEIYQMAFKMLNKSKSKTNASRYKLKKAIMELGPSGFPFEKFIAAIIKAEGFETEVGVIVQGYCVSHEVDVVVENEHKHIMVECKYHNKQGRVNDIKIPLYIKSRFLDIEKQHKKEEGDHFIHEQWIYTNTRFSSEAIKYGECAGLKLVSWDYPHNNSVADQINKHGLFPITTLTTLSKKDIQKLLEKGYVLCKDICSNPNVLVEVGIDRAKHKKIMQNAKELSEYIANNH
ncbi:MAG: ATPase [Bacteroidetes bacterium]|nr:MAG: ATPase [Bacteroidota bacterium]